MRARTSGAVCLAVLVAFVQPGQFTLAAEDEASRPAVTVAIEDSTLALDIKDAPLAEVLKAIAAEAGFALVMRGDLDRPVTWTVGGVAVDQAIRRLVSRDSLMILYAPALRVDGRHIVAVHVRAASGTRIVRNSAAERREPAFAMDPDPDRGTRIREVRRLTWQGGARSVAHLAGFLEAEEDPALRRLAALALGSIGDRRAIPVLAEALADEGSMVRGGAVVALRKLGGERAAALIGDVLHEDPDPAIRQMAARALGRMDHEASWAALVAAESDRNRDVRAVVEASLGRLADAP